MNLRAVRALKVVGLLIICYTTLSVFTSSPEIDIRERWGGGFSRLRHYQNTLTAGDRGLYNRSAFSWTGADEHSLDQGGWEAQGGATAGGSGRLSHLLGNVLSSFAQDQQDDALALEDDPQSRTPVVRSVTPSHGPRAGGIVLIVRGFNFGPKGARLTVAVGGVDCQATRRMTPYALHCMLPPGRGANLPVTARFCDCDDDDDDAAGEGEQGQGGGGKGTGSGGGDSGGSVPSEPVIVRPTLFSYDEDLLSALCRGINLKPRGMPLLMNQQQLAGTHEVRFLNPRTRMDESFVITPSLVTSLPKADVKVRYRSCAVVGHGGSLVGSRLGAKIDAHEVVFRWDNAPSASRFAQDIGRRTTFQVLDHTWAGVLLGMGTGGGGPHVARWWLDVASLVLWSGFSQELFVQLRWLYPEASMMYLSRDFVSWVQHVARELRSRVLRELGEEYPLPETDDDMQSSIFTTIGMAIQVCDRVEVFGVTDSCVATKKVCRSTYYEEAETASEEELAVIHLEQKMLKAIELAGYINITTAAGDSSTETATGEARPSQGGSSADGAETRGAGGVERPLCDEGQCLWNVCDGRGHYVNETCHCEPVYVGADCETDRTLTDAAQILDGIDLRYSLPLTMHKGVVERDWQGNSGERVIRLPKGISLNRTADGDVYRVDDQQYELLPEVDGWGLQPRYNTCAIVGNSGGMLHQRPHFGEFIDSHDLVYRFNQAPVAGFTQYVGARTHVEMLNSAWVKHLLEGNQNTRHSRLLAHWNWRRSDTALVLFELFDPASFKYRNRVQIETKDKWVPRAPGRQGCAFTLISCWLLGWCPHRYFLGRHFC
eukprot:jgi/Mesvir1/12387/Mv00562-RA.2